jgi:hypothetical protein
MPLTRLLAPTLAALALLTAGCGLPTLDLHEAMDLHQASFREKLAGQKALAKDFLACTRQAYDERTLSPHRAEPAETTSSTRSSMDEERLSGNPLAPIQALIERMKAGRQPQADSLSVLENLLTDWMSGSRGRLDLGKLKRVIEVIRQWHDHLDFDEEELSRNSSRFAQLLLAYNKAYFGDLRFAAESTTSGIGIRTVTKVTSIGFTDRNGNAWIFPGLSLEVGKDAGKPLTVAASPVDSQRISADLARVFLEAFFDAAFREPAVHGATALQVEWKDSNQRYPAFDADHAPIPLDALARITRDALRAEASVTSMVGKSVRGGSLFSIQNETLAATMETAAGVIAKKLVEHEGFCYFQVLQRKQPAEGHSSRRGVPSLDSDLRR